MDPKQLGPGPRLPLLTEGNLPEVEGHLDLATSDPRVQRRLDELFARFDLARELKRFCLGGFDTLEDYEKYGDLFVCVSRSSASGTR